MDPFKSSSETILIDTGKQNKGDNGFLSMNLNNKTIKPLKNSKVTRLRNASFCKVSPNVFFVAGGYCTERQETVKEAFIYDLEYDLYNRVDDMSQRRQNSTCLFFKNNIYVLFGKDSQQAQNEVMSCEYYSLVDRVWYKLENYNKAVSEVKSAFFIEDQLSVVINDSQIIKYDFITKKWAETKEFSYSFDSFYPVSTKDCVLVNKEYNVIYSYDCYRDLIGTRAYIEDFKGNSHVYIEEINSIIFLDNKDKSSFVIYECDTSKIYFYDDQAYVKLFNDLTHIRSSQNVSYIEKKNEQLKSNKLGMIKGNSIYIFGNHKTPFKLTFLKEEGKAITWDISPVPESLHLKSEQGLTYYDDNQFIFAGGYEDEEKFEETTDTYLYNPDIQKVQIVETLVNGSGNSKLTRVALPGAVKKFVNIADDDSFIIFMVNEQNEPEYFNPIGKEWTIAAPYDHLFLPNVLDITDALTLFYIDNTVKDKSTFRLKVFLLSSNSWVELFAKEVDFQMYQYFCHKMDQNLYLILTVHPDKGTMITKMNLKFKQDKSGIEDIVFEPIELVTKGIKASIVNYFVYEMTITLLIVDENTKLVIRSFNTTKLQFEESDLSKNFIKAFNDAFFSLRYTNRLWTFNQFSFFCANNLEPE